LDDVIIYSRSLRANEIDDLVSNGPDLNDADIQLYYSFNDGMALDESANNNDGVLNGSVTVIPNDRRGMDTYDTSGHLLKRVTTDPAETTYYHYHYGILQDHAKYDGAVVLIETATYYTDTQYIARILTKTDVITAETLTYTYEPGPDQRDVAVVMSDDPGKAFDIWKYDYLTDNLFSFEEKDYADTQGDITTYEYKDFIDWEIEDYTIEYGPLSAFYGEARTYHVDYPTLLRNEVSDYEALILALQTDPIHPVYQTLSNDNQAYVDGFNSGDEIDFEVKKDIVKDLNNAIETYFLYADLKAYYAGLGGIDSQLSAATIAFRDSILEILAKDEAALTGRAKVEIEWLNRYVLEDLYVSILQTLRHDVLITEEVTTWDEDGETLTIQEFGLDGIINKKTILYPDGKEEIWEYSYPNVFKEVIMIRHIDGFIETIVHKLDEAGNIIEKVSYYLGHVLGYDADDDLLFSVDFIGDYTQYRADGLVDFILTWDGFLTVFDYEKDDVDGNITQKRESTYEVPLIGTPEDLIRDFAVTEALGSDGLVDVNLFGRLTSLITPDGAEVTYEYQGEDIAAVTGSVFAPPEEDGENARFVFTIVPLEVGVTTLDFFIESPEEGIDPEDGYYGITLDIAGEDGVIDVIQIVIEDIGRTISVDLDDVIELSVEWFDLDYSWQYKPKKIWGTVESGGGFYKRYDENNNLIEIKGPDGTPIAVFDPLKAGQELIFNVTTQARTAIDNTRSNMVALLTNDNITSIEDVKLVGIDQVFFDDASLDGYVPGAGPFVEGPISGFMVFLEAGDIIYEYHVDLVGNVYVDPKYEAIRTLIDAAITDIAGLLNITDIDVIREDIKLAGVNKVEFSDDTLGGYNPAGTPESGAIAGYKTFIEHKGVEYEYHADASNIYLDPDIEQSQPLVSSSLTDLAGFLGVLQSTIKVTYVDKITWADASLDGFTADVGLDEVDGYLVMLEVQGRTWEYHTDMTTEHLDPMAIQSKTSVNNARTSLSGRLGGIPVTEIDVVDVNDTGVGGYEILLNVNEVSYRYITNSSHVITEEPEAFQGDGPGVLSEAIDDLKILIGAPSVKVISVEARTWQDDTYGGFNEVDPITVGEIEGLRVILEYNEVEYEYHTNKLIPAEVYIDPDGVEVGLAMEDMISFIRSATGLTEAQVLEDVEVPSVLSTTWEDDGLEGFRTKTQEVDTEGLSMLLKYKEFYIEYRTDGTAVVRNPSVSIDSYNLIVNTRDHLKATPGASKSASPSKLVRIPLSSKIISRVIYRSETSSSPSPSPAFK